MKKLILFLLVLVFFFHSYGQSCLPEGIYFENQSQIDSFQADYPGCNQVEGNVSISSFFSDDPITNLDGLNVLTEIGGDLVIDYNYELTSLSGMENLALIGGNLQISNNPFLSTCSEDWLCSYLTTLNGSVTIFNNVPGCENPADIADNCGIALTCLPYGNYYFTNQEDIDNFQTDYPGCTDLAGDVVLEGKWDCDITDLDGLNMINSINGNLVVNYTIELENLDGLNSLQFLEGDLEITSNEGLVNLEGLENLSEIPGDILIYSNEELNNLSGLENITTLGGSLSLATNDNLENITAFSQLTSIGGSLNLSYNIGLSTLHGLENVTSIGSDLSIEESETLENLSGLNHLATIGGGFYLTSNYSLSNMIGFDSLIHIGSDFEAFRNFGLTDYSGLEHLQTIGGRLIIEENWDLSTLTGLSGLQTIGSDLRIDYNESLVSLTGIDNVTFTPYNYIEIFNNSQLTECAVESICNYIEENTLLAYDNATGCNSHEEVYEACVNGIEDPEAYIESFLVYPNPATNELTIEFNAGINLKEEVHLTIFDLAGKQLISQAISEYLTSIDIDRLPEGIYFIRVNYGKVSKTIKLIKQ